MSEPADTRRKFVSVGAIVVGLVGAWIGFSGAGIGGAILGFIVGGLVGGFLGGLLPDLIEWFFCSALPVIGALVVIAGIIYVIVRFWGA